MHTSQGKVLDPGPALGSNLSIFAKGLILVAIPVLLQFILFLALRQVQTSAVEAERLAIHSKDVITKADDLILLVVQAVASKRAAVIANDADFRDRGSPAPGEIAGRLAELTALVRDNPDQQRRVARVRDAAGRLEAWIAGQRALLRAGRQAEAAQHVTHDEGHELLQQVQQELRLFLDAEEQLDRERTERLRTVNGRALLFTTLSAAATLPLAGVLLWAFSRSIGARLAVLTANTPQLAAGAPLAPLLSGTDEIAQLDRVLHDTAHRLVEATEAERHTRTELEQRAAELASANRELAQQTQENELFIYSVSHDLRSPLVNLDGFSRELLHASDALRVQLGDPAVPAALRARVADTIDRDVPESVRFIRSAVSRAAAIIDALLRLSRAGRIDHRWQPVSIDTLVAHVLDAMHGTIDERGATIVRTPLGDAWGDPTAIEQVFGNLIGNAVTYLDPQRPGVVEIGAADGLLDPDAPPDEDADPSAHERWRTFFVRDNGLGMPAASLAHVFVAFQRLHPRVASGEGIGLALVQRIVERHHGRIWVDSTEGVGTTFYVRLPAVAAAVAGESEARAVPRSDGSRDGARTGHHSHPHSR